MTEPIDQPPAPPQARSVVRVMTYNVGNGRARPETLLPVLERCGADVIALQEVSSWQASFLRPELRELYPHRLLMGHGVPGKGLLSRYPILHAEAFVLRGGRPHLRAELETAAGPLHVVSAHIPLELAMAGRWGPVWVELDALIEVARERPRTVLAGDFNCTPFGGQYRRLARAGLQDAFRAVGRGPGWTFPIFGRFHGVPLPRLVRIDYLWHTADLRARNASVGPDGGSDHRPVLAGLEQAELSDS